jgi:GNAT superfamily N-acetyltransferase
MHPPDSSTLSSGWAFHGSADRVHYATATPHSDQEGTMLRSPPKELIYDMDYREDVILRNGSRVRIRAVLPSDKEHLQEGLQRLSTDAVRARFFSAKRQLTANELSYLTEFDGIDHYAIGAVLLNADGTEGEGLAVGRFVTLPDSPESAEPAVVVLDEWQNQGLGRMIFDRLVAAALERGLRYFHAEFLPGNEGIQRLLEGVCPELMIWRQGDVLVADVPLPGADDLPCDRSSGTLLTTILRLAAEKLIRLRLRAAGTAEAASE